MNLFVYSILTAVLLVAIGTAFAVNRSTINSWIQKFPRSQKLSVLFLSAGFAWFVLGHIKDLSAADFGEYKVLIGAVALFICVCSYIYVKDFLAVRALCILCLFYSREVLDAAFLKEPETRLFLVSIIYLLIVASLYFGAWPYRMRDFLNWLFCKPSASIIFGLILAGCGLLLFGISFTYMGL
jgi:hypothetical protein